MNASQGLAAFLILGAAVLCAFYPAFDAGFVYDDHRLVLYNPVLDRPLDPGALLLDPHASAPDADPDIYRPLSTLAFHVERSLGGGGPFLHHAVGVGVHLLNAFLVFCLLVKLLAAAAAEKKTFWPALLGAGLFALHPVQVESVAWISSRGGQLSAFCVLGALLAALGVRALASGENARASGENARASGENVRAGGEEARAFPIARIVAVIVLTFLACLGKESGMMTGVFILIAWICLPRLRRKDVLAAGIAALAAAGLYLALRLHVLEGTLEQVPPHGGGRLTGLLYGGYGCLYQIGLLFRPWFHNLDFQDGFFDAVPLSSVIAGAAVFCAALGAGVALIRRAPLWACGILVLAAAQFPSSSIAVTLRSLVNDRYLYVPMVGAALLAAALLRGLEAEAVRRWLARGALAALLVLLAFCTSGRSRDWTDSKTLWRAALVTHPGSIRAHVGISKALLEEGRPDHALRTAVEGFRRSRPGTAVRMNVLYKAVEALLALERFDQAETLLERLLAEAAAPDRAEDFRLIEEAYFDLFTLEIRGGRLDEAVKTVERMIGFLGESPVRYDLLGMTLLDAGRGDDAEAAFVRGVSLPGSFADIHYHLADLYTRTGRDDLAGKERARGRAKKEDAKKTLQP